MSNNNNIENFDNFFRESFGNFQPEPPPGVFEAIQTQMGAAPASGAGMGAQMLAKIAKIGLGKVITGAVAVVAVATTVYFAVTTNQSQPQTTTNTVTQTPVTNGEDNNTTTTNVEENSGELNQTNPENTFPPANTSGTEAGTHHNNTHKDNGGQRSTGLGDQTKGKKPLNVENPDKPNTVITETNTANGNTPQTPKQMIPMYISGSFVCPNDIVTITLADDVSKTRYKVNFGDGNIVTSTPGKPITHIYKKQGTYKISATDVGNTKTTREQTVKVGNVNVEFAVENIDKATYRFTNNSACEGNFLTFNWIFGDGATSQEKSPVYTYKSFEASEYKVKLIAVTESGCVDSFVAVVKQTYTYTDQKPIVPNVFSPNGDGINDRFDIGVRNEEKYHLLVVDRAGNTVFESFEKENTWNGTNMFSGEPCPAANYIMVFVYKIKGFDEQKIKGIIDIKR